MFKPIGIWIFLCCVHAMAMGADIPVCKTCPISTIQEAISLSKDGDVIQIQAGTYKEYGMVIDKAITLQAMAEVIVDGQGKGTIFECTGSGFGIKGLRITDVGHSYTKDYAAIRVFQGHDFRIEENTLDKVFFGILIEKSKNGQILRNTVSSESTMESNSGNGIHIWHSESMVIANNTVHHLRDGIYFEFVSKSKILNNTSHHNLRYGLHFMFSNKDEYHDNVFHHNGAGVAVMFSKSIDMKRNTFQDNWGAASYGLLLKEIYDANIEDNSFLRNTTAITAEGSTRINYHGNVFSNNGWAVKIAGACYQNEFHQNDFLNNSFDLSYTGQLNDNFFDSNYWSTYSGYDLDKNGIGDVPYRPVKLFSYVVNQTPETIVLLRSLFVDIMNFSEKVSPVFTPDQLQDHHPQMKANR